MYLRLPDRGTVEAVGPDLEFEHQNHRAREEHRIDPALPTRNLVLEEESPIRSGGRASEKRGDRRRDDGELALPCRHLVKRRRRKPGRHPSLGERSQRLRAIEVRERRQDPGSPCSRAIWDGARRHNTSRSTNRQRRVSTDENGRMRELRSGRLLCADGYCGHIPPDPTAPARSRSRCSRPPPTRRAASQPRPRARPEHIRDQHRIGFHILRQAVDQLEDRIERGGQVGQGERPSRIRHATTSPRAAPPCPRACARQGDAPTPPVTCASSQSGGVSAEERLPHAAGRARTGADGE